MFSLAVTIRNEPNAELSRGPQGHRFELLVLPERSEGKEFDTAQLRIPPERSEGGTRV